MSLVQDLIDEVNSIPVEQWVDVARQSIGVIVDSIPGFNNDPIKGMSYVFARALPFVAADGEVSKLEWMFMKDAFELPIAFNDFCNNFESLNNDVVKQIIEEILLLPIDGKAAFIELGVLISLSDGPLNEYEDKLLTQFL